MPLRPDDGRLLRGSRSRARIRDSARALFEERGFDATTLRDIARRAGMGASSIYRHIESKEELLVEQFADLQERAWLAFRQQASARAPGAGGLRAELRQFLDAEHALLTERPDLANIALRATTHPGARVARHALALQDRTIGLLMEILQSARLRGELRREVDLMLAARAIAHLTSGARIAWVNGLLGADECRRAIHASLALLLDGLLLRQARTPHPD